jgi:hypothetical protein
MKPRRQPDWCRMVLAADWVVKHLILQALLPGLSPGEIKSIKRRVRAAQDRRHLFCELVREEVRATLARWEKLEPPKKPVRPVQLSLPLPAPPRTPVAKD